VAPANQNDIEEKLAQAKSRFMNISGVLGVGVGLKASAGKFTKQLSWVVFVRKKKPLTNLSQAEIIPAEMFGYPTDVWQVPSLRRLGCTIDDKFDVLVGGARISNLKRYTATSNLAGDDLGTLGFFGTLNSSSSRDNIVLISNNHVISANGAAVGDPFFQPGLTGSSPNFSLTRENMHPIGTIENLGLQGEHPFQYPGDPPPAPGAPPSLYHVDCATVKVSTSFSSCCHTNCGTKFANILHNLNQAPGMPSSDVTGIERLSSQSYVTSPDYPHYKVFKVGEKTGWTVGEIAIPTMTWIDPVDSSIVYNNVMIISDAGPNCGGGSVFAAAGDSGSVVLNKDRKIIGHLIGDLPGITPAVYLACHIHPTVDFLGITMVSTQNTAGASGGATSLEMALSLDEPSHDMERALALRETVLGSARGREYRALIEKHVREVVHLVNHVRPVTVAWHRLHGPDFLGHILHASRHAAYSVPRELNGLGRDEALRRILETLHQHGSALLRDDIERNTEEVRAFFNDVDDLETLAAQIEISRMSLR
jgi:hypothetical protein